MFGKFLWEIKQLVGIIIHFFHASVSFMRKNVFSSKNVGCTFCSFSYCSFLPEGQNKIVCQFKLLRVAIISVSSLSKTHLKCRLSIIIFAVKEIVYNRQCKFFS